MMNKLGVIKDMENLIQHNFINKYYKIPIKDLKRKMTGEITIYFENLMN